MALLHAGSLNPSNDLTGKHAQFTCPGEVQWFSCWAVSDFFPYSNWVLRFFFFFFFCLVTDPTRLSSSFCLSCALDMPLVIFFLPCSLGWRLEMWSGRGWTASQKRPAFQTSHGLQRSQGLPPPIKHRTSLATKAQFRIVFIMEI